MVEWLKTSISDHKTNTIDMGSMSVTNLVFPDNIQHSTLRLFADDNIIYKQIKNKEDAIKLQQDLDAAGKWEQDWLMHFHPDKCTVVSVTQKRKTISHTYQLHGHTLEEVDCKLIRHYHSE